MNAINRRNLLGTAMAGGALLTLPGCVTGFPQLSMTEVIRRLLLRASDGAFARLTEQGGFWDEQVARLGLGNLLGTRGDVLGSILTSSLVTDRLEDVFADIAVEGSFVAAPIVRDAVETIGWENALALVRGGPTAASDALRGEIGSGLVNAMVPELGDAIRVAQDPLVGQLLSAATGTDISGIATQLAGNIDDAVWGEIAREESAIRANPEATNDPVLIGAFGVGSRL